MTKRSARAEDDAAPGEGAAPECRTNAARGGSRRPLRQGDAALAAGIQGQAPAVSLADMEHLRKRTAREVADAELRGVHLVYLSFMLSVAGATSVCALDAVTPEKCAPALKSPPPRRSSTASSWRSANWPKDRRKTACASTRQIGKSGDSNAASGHLRNSRSSRYPAGCVVQVNSARLHMHSEQILPSTPRLGCQRMDRRFPPSISRYASSQKSA